MSFELLLLGVDSTVSMASYTCIIFVIFNAYFLLINDYDYDLFLIFQNVCILQKF